MYRQAKKTDLCPLQHDDMPFMVHGMAAAPVLVRPDEADTTQSLTEVPRARRLEQSLPRAGTDSTFHLEQEFADVRRAPIARPDMRLTATSEGQSVSYSNIRIAS